MSLPPPSEKQPYCNVSALEAGLIDLPIKLFIAGAPEDEVLQNPSFSFLIRHSGGKPDFMFDLGIRADPENFPPVIQNVIKEFFPVDIPQDSPTSLEKGGLSPHQIPYVCLSHCHWDHIGDPRLWPKAQFLVGEEARPLFTPGYPADQSSAFPADLLPADRTTFLSTKDWKPIGPFPRALDFFGDGSLYIVDSPGHLPGHINALVRTSSDGGWLYLAGDSVHDRRLLTGEGSVAFGTSHYNGGCAHTSKELAEENISRIKEVMKLPRVRILLAHDFQWFQENRAGKAFWPGKIDTL